MAARSARTTRFAAVGRVLGLATVYWLVLSAIGTSDVGVRPSWHQVCLQKGHMNTG